MNTQSRRDTKIDRLIQLGYIFREREDEAAAAGNWLLASAYNRARLRCSRLLIALHFRAHEYYGLALRVNEFTQAREIAFPGSYKKESYHALSSN